MAEPEPQAFCQAMMHEYERRWSCSTGHAVRHPLGLKMARLASMCADELPAGKFESELREACSSEEPGARLLAEELLPLWSEVRRGGALPFVRG